MYPQAKTLGLVLKEDCILLKEQNGPHSKGEGDYYRPIGGTIELGETSAETLMREFKEELSVEVSIEQYVTCLENIFSIHTNIGHEIIQIYLVKLNDPTLYKKERFDIKEGNKMTYAKWIPIVEVEAGQKVLFPNGLPELLQEKFLETNK